jgi:Flp pilus assembly protein TadD
MSVDPRLVLAAVACLSLLTACQSTLSRLSLTNPPAAAEAETAGSASGATAEATGTVASAPEPVDDAGLTASAKALLGGDPSDDLSMGKKYFRDGNYGLAERAFRRAAETGPRDAEAWLGLAASYDRLKRFDLADRAYAQVLRIAGPTASVLNNIGYSYMLRGDYRRARAKLAEAQAKEPENPFVQTNLQLLEESQRTRKAIR